MWDTQGCPEVGGQVDGLEWGMGWGHGGGWSEEHRSGVWEKSGLEKSRLEGSEQEKSASEKGTGTDERGSWELGLGWRPMMGCRMYMVREILYLDCACAGMSCPGGKPKHGM